MRLTRRGWIVVWILFGIAAWIFSGIDALWWTDNPVPVR